MLLICTVISVNLTIYLFSNIDISLYISEEGKSEKASGKQIIYAGLEPGVSI